MSDDKSLAEKLRKNAKIYGGNDRVLAAARLDALRERVAELEKGYWLDGQRYICKTCNAGTPADEYRKQRGGESHE